MDLFNATVVGRVGSDIRRFGDEEQHASFSFATTGWVKEEKTTTWLEATIFNFSRIPEWKQETVLKGSALAIAGEVTTREYETKDGNKGRALNFKVNTFTPVGGKKGEGENGGEVPF